MSFAGRLLLMAAAVLLVSTVAVAGGFQLNEHGAKAMAQAGAFAARASDASAIFFNPAGLAFQSRPSVYLGATLIAPKTSFYGPLQQNSSAKTELNSMLFTPINVYASYPLVEGLTVGMGVNNPYGLGTEWPETWVGRYITTKVDLKTFFFTPTVAYQLTDNLAIGGGMNYVTGDVTLERIVSVISIALPNGEPKVALSLSGHGIGWNAGVMFKATPELSFGLSYRSSVKIDADGSAKFTPNYAALALPEGDASASLTLPATGFVGAAYKVSPELTVEADLQYIWWSSYDELRVEFKKNNSFSAAPKKYEDTWIARIGAEYTLTPSLRLRGGYFFDHSPVKLEYSEPLLPDANRNGLNIGFGYDLTDNITVDVAYLLLLFEEKKAVNTIPEISFDGTYHSTVNLIGVNFGYTF